MYLYLFLIYLYVVLRIELSVSYMPGKCSATELKLQPLLSQVLTVTVTVGLWLLALYR